MKALAALLILALPARAIDLDALKAKPDELRNVKTANLTEIEKNLQKFRGKLVKVKFACRDKLIEEVPCQGLWKGTIWFFDSKCESGSMEVWLPKEGLDWFSRISVDSLARKPIFAYVRLLDDDSDQNGLVLGREIKQGLKGPELIW